MMQAMMILQVAVAMSAVACPAPDWRGECSLMETSAREYLANVASAYTNMSEAKCVDALESVREVLLAPVGRHTVWQYEGTVKDTEYEFVGAQTIRHAGAPNVNLGVSARTLAREAEFVAAVMLHEGAHISGANEARARHIERVCVRRW